MATDHHSNLPHKGEEDQHGYDPMLHPNKRRMSHVSQNASLPSILPKSLRHVIRSFLRWMRSWRIDVKLRCFGKWCFYICIALIRSVFSSSLPLVYLFLSLNVCLGMLVFLEPFLNGGLLFSRKASPTVMEKWKMRFHLVLLPGPSRRLEPVIKCSPFLSFFQRYIVRDISLTWDIAGSLLLGVLAGSLKFYPPFWKAWGRWGMEDSQQ